MKASRREAIGRTALALVPLVLVLFYGLLLSVSSTRDTARKMMDENHHVELVTFGSLFLGTIFSVALAWRSRRTLFVSAFFALFALGLLFTAGEEAAWGQTFFDFETPRALKGLNRQNELTLHNLEGFHNRTEFFRIAFGVGGLVGVWLSWRGRLRPIAAPPVLLPWFLLITLLAGLDLVNDFYRIHRQFDRNIHELSEVVEMMVGLAALLYAWIKLRTLPAR